MLCSVSGELIYQKQHASPDSVEKYHSTVKEVDLSYVLQKIDSDTSYETFNELLYTQIN